MDPRHRLLIATAAICALLSVITTIGIHGFITGPATFEEALHLYKTSYYIFSKWWVIFHCLFVVISMYGISMCVPDSAFSRLGLTFYVAFGLTEIFRMLLVLHYLRVIRDRYLTADAALQEIIRVNVDAFAGISETLFTAFTLFILLGNLFTGIAALSATGLIRWVGYALFVWTFVLILSLFNVYFNNPSIDLVINYFSLSIQPLIRLSIAAALINTYKESNAGSWSTVNK